jgi:PAS domain S-box-containing protein
MSGDAEFITDEGMRMRDFVNNIAKVINPPLLRAGDEPEKICSTLADTLLATLKLAFVFIAHRTSAEPAIETVRCAETIGLDFPIQHVAGLPDSAIGQASLRYETRVRIAGRDFGVSIYRIEIKDGMGTIVAGAERHDFPQETERLLLDVAANQIGRGLHTHLLKEQERATLALEERLEQRTCELSKANEQLEKQDRESRLIVENIPGMVALMSPTGDLDMVNGRLSEYFDQTLEQLKLWQMSDTVHPADLHNVIEIFSRSINAGTPFDSLQRFKRGDGVYRWVQNRVFPVRNAHGDIDRWCVLLTDVDDQKRAEEALRERELNLRQITETIPEMLWSSPPDGFIDYCNGRLLEFTGLTPAEMPGARWIEFLHPDDVERAVKAWIHSIRTGDPYRVEARTFHASDHTYRWCVIRALPLADSEGQIVRWHGTLVDMHDWKLAQEELRRTQAELAKVMRVMTMGELTASIAHEVNQPLSGIITNASICLRMLSANPPNINGARDSTLRTIRDGNRAAEVIARLRSFFTRDQFVNEPLDLNEAAKEIISLQMEELQRNQVIVRHEFESQLPMVIGDRIQIQQVILNLIRNASDAMKDLTTRPRLLFIKTECDDEESVRLSVKDVGDGFDAGAMGRLFEPFYTTKADGMGIGLSLSRSIVEAHQGRIWAEPNDCQGSTFAFSIPAERSNNSALARKS